MITQARQLGVTLGEQELDLLEQFLQLLGKWNKAFNLTAITAHQDMFITHVLDSLSVLPHLSANTILDVGSGGGLPGIPLACLSPDKHFTLLDANSKKTRFLQQCIIELGLSNVEVVHHRIESFQPANKFGIIVSRAFATIEAMVLGSQHCLSDNGCFLAMKGRFPQSEIDDLPANFEMSKAIEVTVPGLNAERHLLLINRK